jgi:hypothetical protein
LHRVKTRCWASRKSASGCILGGGGTERLPQLVGRGRALEIILGANDFDGDTAERYGYVNRALPDAELDGFVDTLARRIASFDRRAVAAAKNLVNQVSLPSADRLLDALNSFQTALTWNETQQRIEALLKRGLQRDTDFERRWPEVLSTLGELGGNTQRRDHNAAERSAQAEISPFGDCLGAVRDNGGLGRELGAALGRERRAQSTLLDVSDDSLCLIDRKATQRLAPYIAKRAGLQKRGSHGLIGALHDYHHVVTSDRVVEALHRYAELFGTCPECSIPVRGVLDVPNALISEVQQTNERSHDPSPLWATLSERRQKHASLHPG